MYHNCMCRIYMCDMDPVNSILLLLLLLMMIIIIINSTVTTITTTTTINNLICSKDCSRSTFLL